MKTQEKSVCIFNDSCNDNLSIKNACEKENNKVLQNNIIQQINSMEDDDLKYICRIVNNIEEYKYAEHFLLKFANEYYDDY